MISRNTILFPAIIGIVGASLSVTAAESEEDGTVILFGVWTATTTVVISCWLTVFPVT